jgi:hypothetical protein
MLAILVSDLLILVVFFMLDIKLGSDYNELFKTFSDKVTIIRNQINNMAQCYQFYLTYENKGSEEIQLQDIPF